MFDEDTQRQINFAVGKYSSNRPRALVLIEAEKIAKDALKEWTPSKGNKNTFLSSRLRKLSRASYKASTPLSKPESRIIQGRRFKLFYDEFVDREGREPTPQETARSLSVGVRDAKLLASENFTIRTESSFGGTRPLDTSFSNRDMISSLSEKDREVGRIILGEKGAKTSLSDSFLARRKADVNKKIKSISLKNSLENTYVR